MSLNCTETHTFRHINTHASMQTNTTGSSVLICSSLHVHLHFHHHLLPRFPSIPLCLVQWRGEDGREQLRKGRVCLCACCGCIWKFLRHSGGVVVIQGVIQGDNEKTDKSTLILMWLIPSSAPPFLPASCSLSPTPPLSFSLISPRSIPTSNGVSLSLCQPPFPPFLPPPSSLAHAHLHGTHAQRGKSICE